MCITLQKNYMIIPIYTGRNLENMGMDMKDGEHWQKKHKVGLGQIY